MEPYPETAADAAPGHSGAALERSTARRPVWALPLVVVAIVAVIVAFGFGVRGLVGNPLVATDAAGVSTLHGSFEAFPCPTDLPRCVQGYVQAGGRSVFVRFPEGCASPNQQQTVTVHGRFDRSLGKGGYQATGCAELG